MPTSPSFWFTRQPSNSQTGELIANYQQGTGAELDRNNDGIIVCLDDTDEGCDADES